ncbi:hypothetical protein HNQ64_003808 [Prosthecobacter dejongeii]|uniref:Uncharacterized protein n=1 Tax=Prosthecobacter dejongeii TaxID=48465 RepID=A0A7W7YNP2_9BACT|nr:hypothetical protein [Prosthecobacter dejongeii]
MLAFQQTMIGKEQGTTDLHIQDEFSCLRTLVLLVQLGRECRPDVFGVIRAAIAQLSSPNYPAFFEDTKSFLGAFVL